MTAVICFLPLFCAMTAVGARQESAPARPSSAPATQQASAPASRAATNGKAQRIVLRVNRNLEVRGNLELEDNNVIVVRDLDGNLQSFPKARVGQIVRLVEPEPGQTGMVVMLDGQIREGIIIEDNFDFVIVEIEGIRANLKRSTVSHVTLSPTVDEQYRTYKDAMQPGDHDAHLTLCRWLFEKQKYQSAHDELLDLLERVEMSEARQLLNIIKAQLALQAPHENDDAGQGGAPPGPPRQQGDDAMGHDDPGKRAVIDDRLVTQEDVNLIRVYEIDFDDPPRITISPDTVRTLIEKYGTSSLIPADQTGRNALFRSAADQPLKIVWLMFQLRARDLYARVEVNSEPHALNLFRQRVHDGWLMNNCATNSCHGGSTAGRFYLHRRDYKDDRVRFTNLLIIERLEIDPEWPLINYEKPEDSLIIQYGLSRELARKPHPRVDGWKAAFTQGNPRLKQQAVEWIRAMMQPRPEYPVDYEPMHIGEAKDAQPAKEEPIGKAPR